MSNQLINKPPLGTPLNRIHPLAQGLVGSWLFNEGSGGALANSVTNKLTYPSNPNLLWVGGDWSNDGTVDRTAVTDLVDSWDNTVSYSWELIVMPHATLAGHIIGKTGGSWEYTIVFIGGPVIRFQRYNTSGSSAFSVDNSGTLPIKFHHFCLVYDSSDMKGRIYINGALNATSGAVATTFQIRTTTKHTIGNGYSSSNLNGKIRKIAYYKKALTPQEIQSLYIDPYQMFRPSMPYWFWGGVAEITGTIEGSFDRLTGSLTIVHGVSGSIAGSADRLSGSITTVHGVSGTVTGTLDRLSTSIDGVTGYTGTLTGSLLRLGGSLSGAAYELVSGTIEGELDELTGQFTGTISIDAIINGELDRLTGSISGRYGSFGRKNLYIELEVGV